MSPRALVCPRLAAIVLVDGWTLVRVGENPVGAPSCDAGMLRRAGR